MKILVVGGGGREHALAWKLRRSSRSPQIFCAPGNAGTAILGENVPVLASDLPGLLHFAKEAQIDLTVIGPDDPLAAGVAEPSLPPTEPLPGLRVVRAAHSGDQPERG